MVCFLSDTELDIRSKRHSPLQRNKYSWVDKVCFQGSLLQRKKRQMLKQVQVRVIGAKGSESP